MKASPTEKKKCNREESMDLCELEKEELRFTEAVGAMHGGVELSERREVKI